MSIVIINDTLRANARPLIEKLANSYGKTKCFDEVLEDLQEGRIQLEPGDPLSCVINKEFKGANLGIEQLQHSLVKFLSESTDAYLIYNEFILPKVIKAGGEVLEIGIDNLYKFENLGETNVVNLENIKLVFSSGPINTLDNYGRSLVSLYGYNPNADGGGRLEMTHIGGFDNEKLIKIPVHVEVEEDILRPAILHCKVKLPPKPSGKILEIIENIKEGQSAVINIEQLGLHVPYRETTFTVTILFSSGGINTYLLKPRIINGLIIEPSEFGKKLELKLAYKSPDSVKTLYTCLCDKNDKTVPVKLTVNIR